MRLEEEMNELLDYYQKRTEILEKQIMWMAKELADVYLSEICSSDNKEEKPEYWIAKAEQDICNS